MSRTIWVLALVCAVGIVLGWWLMGVLVSSGNKRPELVQRIASLPQATELPSLAPGHFVVLDSLESPGGAVWTLLGPASVSTDSAALVCGFPRRSEGGVQPPECSPLEGQLAKQAHLAKFAVGGREPALIVPEPNQPLGARAINPRSKLALELESSPAGLSVATQRGTRLVKRFDVVRTGSGAPRLLEVSPEQGHYVGPVSGYASTSPPQGRRQAQGQLLSCVTPAGYVQARLPPNSQQGNTVEVEVSFISKAKEVGKVTGRLPSVRNLEAPFSCGPSSAIFTWFDAHERLVELSCTPDGCQRTSAELPEVSADQVLALGRIGDASFVVWRSDKGQPLLRLGPLSRFAQSPTAPLWQAPLNQSAATSQPWKFVGSIVTGQSVLLFAALERLKVLQVHADGTLEALKPEDKTAAKPAPAER